MKTFDLARELVLQLNSGQKFSPTDYHALINLGAHIRAYEAKILAEEGAKYLFASGMGDDKAPQEKALAYLDSVAKDCERWGCD